MEEERTIGDTEDITEPAEIRSEDVVSENSLMEVSVPRLEEGPDEVVHHGEHHEHHGHYSGHRGHHSHHRSHSHSNRHGSYGRHHSYRDRKRSASNGKKKDNKFVGFLKHNKNTIIISNS